MKNGPSPPRPASDGTTGVYSIAVGAELTGMSVQALRLYERKGLLRPHRTAGGTRRYSDTDIVRLRRIHNLINDGVNLTGIARVLSLEDDNTTIRGHHQHLRADNRTLRTDNHQRRTDNADLRAAHTTLHPANDARTADPPPAEPAAPNN